MRRTLVLLAALAVAYFAYRGEVPGMHWAPKVPLEGTFERESPLIRGAVEQVTLSRDGTFHIVTIDGDDLVEPTDGHYDYDGNVGRVALARYEFELTLSGDVLTLKGVGEISKVNWVREYSRVR